MNLTTAPTFLSSLPEGQDPLSLDGGTTLSSLTGTDFLGSLVTSVSDTILDNVKHTLSGYFTTASTQRSGDDSISSTFFPASPDTTSTANTSGAQVAAKPQSAEAYDPVDKYLMPIILPVGMVLNVFNLLVLTESRLQTSPYVYLTAMASLCLTALTIDLVHRVFLAVCAHNYYCLSIRAYFIYPSLNICANSTMWVTVTLTIERFLFVNRPLLARDRCDTHSAKVKTCVIIALMMVFNIPRFMLYEVLQNNTTGEYDMKSTDFRQGFIFEVISWIYSTIIQCIPMVLLCVINIYLVFAVHRSRNLRKRLEIRNNQEHKWSREQSRLTITLMAIVFLFLLCIMPSAFSDLHIAYTLYGRGQDKTVFKNSDLYKEVQKITNLLVTVQMSFNFVLYSIFNAKFLAVFRRMMQRWGDRLSRCRQSKRKHQNNFTNSRRKQQRLMRINTSTSTNSVEKNGHGKAQLRSSNNSMSSGKHSTSSGKDLSQTKSSILEMAM